MYNSATFGSKATKIWQNFNCLVFSFKIFLVFRHFLCGLTSNLASNTIPS